MESVQFVQSCARIATVQCRPLRSPVISCAQAIPHSARQPALTLLRSSAYSGYFKKTLLRGVPQGTRGDFTQGRGAVTTGRGATAWKRAGRTRDPAQPCRQHRQAQIHGQGAGRGSPNGRLSRGSIVGGGRVLAGGRGDAESARKQGRAHTDGDSY